MHLQLFLVHSTEPESETTVGGRSYLSAVRKHCTERIQPPDICTRQVKLSVRHSPLTDRIIFTCPRTASCPLLQSARHTPSVLFASSRTARGAVPVLHVICKLEIFTARKPITWIPFPTTNILLSAHILHKDRPCISSFQKRTDRSAS
jgi:hypothetical protein